MPLPHGMTFQRALRAGYAEVRSRGYMKAVKRLPCVVCDAPADDPHHPHGVGYKGMGTKVPDVWAIPLCRGHHDELHHDVRAWEAKYGSQYEHACLTFARLFWSGDVQVTPGAE